MAMHEIDYLLKDSIKLIQNSNLEGNRKKNVVRNLETLPEDYEFDAGGFNKTEVDENFEYKKINPFELGVIVSQEAIKQKSNGLIYDWSAFLLNFSNEGYHFYGIFDYKTLKSTYLKELKNIFSTLNFESYEPQHATLTLHKNGNEWFSEELNELIKWYCI